MARRKSAEDPYVRLGWADLEDWAGSRIVQRGKRYQQNGCVSGLARTPGGGLIAWVSGSKRYATTVAVEGGEITSNCTCPYELTCKHAVAVVLEYLDRLKNSKPIPTSPGTDERLEMIASNSNADDEELWGEDSENEDDLRESGANRDAVARFIEEKTKAELVQLITALVERHPGLSEDILDRKRLEKGHAQPILKRLRCLIRTAGAEAGWQDHWRHVGFTPDYSEVREKLQELLEAGHADDVVTLGREIMSVGQDQVERSNDEGETGMEISACMPVIESALHQSSLPPAKKLIWVVEALLNDEFDLLEPLAKYLDRPHANTDWGLLADNLLAKLSKFSSHRTTEHGRNYSRDRLSDWAISALQRAGRSDEIIPLCEREAPITLSYPRLVKALITAKRVQEAERRIYEGISATGSRLPGIGAQLRQNLLEIRRRSRDTAAVAALTVDKFVRSPGERTYADCRRAAEKVKYWEPVRQGLLAYLETGKRPWTTVGWPLPKTGTETLERLDLGRFPQYGELIAIAIHEKRPDQVIHWYDRMPKRGHNWYGSVEEQVANALRASYPDRAAAIWKVLAERWIGQVQPKAYREAAVYLRKLKSLLAEIGRDGEWAVYVDKIRAEHARKRSLLDVLDALERKPIIKGP